MSYNTLASFTSGSFTQGAFDSIDPGIIQLNLDLAQNIIDDSLRPHHTLPLPTDDVPPLVLDLERVIAAYYLWQSQGINPGTGTGILEKRFEWAMGNPDNPASGILGQLRYGKMAMVNAKDTDPTPVKTSVKVVGGNVRSWNQGCGPSRGRVVF